MNTPFHNDFLISHLNNCTKLQIGNQCVRGNRAADCIYEDNRQTPTNKLSARIAELEGILRSYNQILASGGPSSVSLGSKSASSPTAHFSGLSVLSSGAAGEGLRHAQSYVRVGDNMDQLDGRGLWGPTRGIQEIRAQLGPSGTAELAAGGASFGSSNGFNPTHPSLTLKTGTSVDPFLDSREEWDVDDVPLGVDRELL